MIDDIEQPKTVALKQTGAHTVDVPLHFQYSELLAQQEVLRVLQLIEQKTVKWTTKSRVPTKSARDLFDQHVLITPDFLCQKEVWQDIPWRWPDHDGTRCDAWGKVFYYGKYIKLTNDVAKLTRVAQTSQNNPPHELLKDLWSRWCQQKRHEALKDLKHVKHKGKRWTSVHAVETRRPSLIETLKRCPVDGWVHIKDFVHDLLAMDRFPEILTDHSKLRIKTRYLNAQSMHDQRRIGWIYISAFLVRYAATLGLIDLAYLPPNLIQHDFAPPHRDGLINPYDGLQAIRLTSLGAYILDLTTTYTPPETTTETNLKVLDNGDVVCLEPPDHFTLAILDTYASSTGPSTWNLHKTTILAAMDMGAPLQNLWDFLNALPEAIPPNVTLMLEDIQRRQRTLTNLGPHHVLYLDDPILLKELTHHRTTKKYCTPAGAHHLIVPTQHLNTFRKALQKLGYVLPIEAAP